MSGMRTIGKWVAVATKGLGMEKKTESGIIYTEKITNPNIWSEVVSVGDKVTEDIKVGDKILWDITKGSGKAWGGYDIVHQDNIIAVERE